MAVMTAGLTACGDDSDEPDGGDIVGTWSSDLAQEMINAMEDIYSSGEDIIQFRKDGTFVEVSVLHFTKEWLISMPMTKTSKTQRLKLTTEPILSREIN